MTQEICFSSLLLEPQDKSAIVTLSRHEMFDTVDCQSCLVVPISQCLDQTPGGPGSGGACVNTVWIILSRGNKKPPSIIIKDARAGQQVPVPGP